MPLESEINQALWHVRAQKAERRFEVGRIVGEPVPQMTTGRAKRSKSLSALTLSRTIDDCELGNVHGKQRM
jgi:hypothetical protein